MGLEKAVDYWNQHNDFQMILVTVDNRIFVTEGLEGKFQLNEASRGIPLQVIYHR